MTSDESTTQREHPQDPAEGPDDNPPADTPRVHPRQPAEGADDPAVTEESGG